MYNYKLVLLVAIISLASCQSNPGKAKQDPKLEDEEATQNDVPTTIFSTTTEEESWHERKPLMAIGTLVLVILLGIFLLSVIVGMIYKRVKSRKVPLIREMSSKRRRSSRKHNSEPLLNEV